MLDKYQTKELDLLKKSLLEGQVYHFTNENDGSDIQDISEYLGDEFSVKLNSTYFFDTFKITRLTT